MLNIFIENAVKIPHKLVFRARWELRNLLFLNVTCLGNFRMMWLVALRFMFIVILIDS